MRVHSYTIIHYGKDYLSYALQSISPIVDKMHVIYTPHPSHGTQTNIPPIETKEEIQQSIFSHLFEKIEWYTMQGIYHEGQQRDKAVEICKDAGADLILVVDYDEIWDSEVLARFLDDVWRIGDCRKWLVNMLHLWRSFNWAIQDNGWPVRVIDLRLFDVPESNNIHDVGYFSDAYKPSCFHFGYAVTNDIMKYKWQIHGHKNELRSNWFRDKWDVWPPAGDCHPTNDQDFWIPEPFDKNKLPEIMKSHPFWNKEKIE